MDYLYNFEIYFPLKDKDSKEINPQKLLEVKDEIVSKFGGITMTPIFGNPVYDGFWKSPKTKRVVKDKNSIFIVLTAQDEESINFFRNKKLEWTRNLNYEELLITVHEVQAL